MAITKHLFWLMLTAAAVSPAAARQPASGGRQCIPLRAIKAETAETDSRLIFHAYDGSAYVNHLPAPCDGLLAVNNLGRLRLVPKGSRLCAGDEISLERGGLTAAITGGEPDPATTCRLGTFEPVSEMSISELLRR